MVRTNTDLGERKRAEDALRASEASLLEAQRLPEIDCVAMRYGFFYGPDTWYTNAGDMGDQVRILCVPNDSLSLLCRGSSHPLDALPAYPVRPSSQSPVQDLSTAYSGKKGRRHAKRQP